MIDCLSRGSRRVTKGQLDSLMDLSWFNFDYRKGRNREPTCLMLESRELFGYGSLDLGAVKL